MRKIFKKCTGLVAVAVFLLAGLLGVGTFAGEAIAADLDATTRTIPLNAAGDTVTLSVEEFTRGQRKFNQACAICHLGGITKTNPNVGLDSESLAGAFPDRNNLEGLIDYLHNPTTYDGLVEISELHPSTQSTDIFPKMRNLTEDDLKAISGHILLMPKIRGDQWGAGKTKSL
ncbi:MAG: photosystem II cytochrome c-550 [Cyanobacteria bacterium J06623_4]